MVGVVPALLPVRYSRTRGVVADHDASVRVRGTQRGGGEAALGVVVQRGGEGLWRIVSLPARRPE